MPLGLGPFLDQIVTVLLLIAAAVGGFHLYKKYVKPSQPTQLQAAPSATTAKRTDSAEEILQDRYARGEIDRAHYLDMIQNLRTQSIAGSSRPAGNLSAVEIARERYARGEINRTQFQEMMDDLKHDNE
jgi:uncharacterized membrane protein